MKLWDDSAFVSLLTPDHFTFQATREGVRSVVDADLPLLPEARLQLWNAPAPSSP